MISDPRQEKTSYDYKGVVLDSNRSVSIVQNNLDYVLVYWGGGERDFSE